MHLVSFSLVAFVAFVDFYQSMPYCWQIQSAARAYILLWFLDG